MSSFNLLVIRHADRRKPNGVKRGDRVRDGWPDQLTPKGVRQALAIARAEMYRDVSLVVVSPTERTRLTAVPLVNTHGVPYMRAMVEPCTFEMIVTSPTMRRN